MGFLGRFSFAASYSLFSLAALTCLMASGSATKAADGDRDVASAAGKAAPPAAAKAKVTVEADGSLLVRQHDVQPHELVIGADAPLDGHAVHDITSADSAETSEAMQIVRQKSLDSDELADDALVDEGLVRALDNSKVDSDAAAMGSNILQIRIPDEFEVKDDNAGDGDMETNTPGTMTWKQIMLAVCIIGVVVVLVCVCFATFCGVSMAPPPKPPPQQPVVYVMPAQQQDTSGASRQSN